MTVGVTDGVGAELMADASAFGGSRLARFRTRLANVTEDGDGLLSEMRLGLPPERRLPWRDRASREWALRQLTRGPYPGMSEDEQRDAVEHVKATPFYD